MRPCVPMFAVQPCPYVTAGAESERMLVSGAPLKGVPVDVYGYLDEEGYHVDDVALVESRVSLAEWLDDGDWAELDEWCNEHLPTVQELRQEYIDQARIDALEWERLDRRH